MKKRIATMALSAAMTATVLSGCSSASTTETTNPTENVESTPEATEIVETEAPTVEPTEEVTEAPTEESASANTEISDDVFSWQVAIEGVTYTFPCSVQEFLKNGWTLEDEGKLRKNYSTTLKMVKDDISFQVDILNDSEDSLAYEDCNAVGLYTFDTRWDEGLDVVLPNNVALSGALTYDEVVEKYGKPTEEKIYDDYIYAKYIYNDDIHKKLEFDFQDNGDTLKYVMYQNY